jgi:hypothetical protein
LRVGGQVKHLIDLFHGLPHKMRIDNGALHKLGAPVDAGRGNEIDHANRVAATEQQSNKVRTDETGAARDKTSLRCRAIGLFSYCFLCTPSSDVWMAEAGPPNLAGTPGRLRENPPFILREPQDERFSVRKMGRCRGLAEMRSCSRKRASRRSGFPGFPLETRGNDEKKLTNCGIPERSQSAIGARAVGPTQGRFHPFHRTAV